MLCLPEPSPQHIDLYNTFPDRLLKQMPVGWWFGSCARMLQPRPNLLLPHLFIVLDWGGEGVIFGEWDLYFFSMDNKHLHPFPGKDEVIQEFASGLLAVKMGMYFCLLHISGFKDWKVGLGDDTVASSAEGDYYGFAPKLFFPPSRTWYEYVALLAATNLNDQCQRTPKARLIYFWYGPRYSFTLRSFSNLVEHSRRSLHWVEIAQGLAVWGWEEELWSTWWHLLDEDGKVLQVITSAPAFIMILISTWSLGNSTYVRLYLSWAFMTG